jgi:PKD repeat protein
MKQSLYIFFMFFYFNIYSQNQTKKALFLGNSYTFYNNLPQLIAEAALSTGDTLIFDSNTPGGYTLEGHSTNDVSLTKIMEGDWNYVVLQEQSQLPSFPIEQVEEEVFPYAEILDSTINFNNPCAETVFYMTWGRMNGDYDNCISWPPVCTYQGMDSLLNLRYQLMAENNQAILSPVGRVWNYIRQNFPSINLYNADESHPSPEGSYVAACTFYTVLFRKNPEFITYNFTLSASDAENIRVATKIIVFDSLMNWQVGAYDPISNFTYLETALNQFTFQNNSLNSASSYWSFGDGNTSDQENPVHTYSNAGDYSVTHIAINCEKENSTTQTINTSTSTIEETENQFWNIYPNPTQSLLNINQKYKGNTNYKIYNITGIEVQNGAINSAVNSLSVLPLQNGIYFIKLFNKDKLIATENFIKVSE